MEHKKIMIHKKGAGSVKFAPKGATPPAPAEKESPPPFVPKQADIPPEPQAAPVSQPVNHDLIDLYRAELDALKDQMFAFQELGSAVLDPAWTSESVIEQLMMLTRTLLYDAVALVLLDAEGRLQPPVMRGFNYQPAPHVTTCWNKAVSSDGTLIWNRILDTLSDPTPVAGWLAAERFCSCGFVPIQDNARIYGFIIIGSRELHATDDFSLGVLRLVTQRMAMAILLRNLQMRGPASPAATEPVASPVAATARPTRPPEFDELKVQLSLAADFAHLLRNASHLSADRVTLAAADCVAAVKAAVALVEKAESEYDA